MVEPAFAERLVTWQQVHGRHDLPWQVADPYRIWLSEIMLQQTQVTAVLRYFALFLHRFPSIESLAAASPDDVMAVWSGLGYYSRARNLHRAAQMVVDQFGGVFPDTRQEIEQLPGVGRSTAAAIAAFAFGRREAILDGNVKRVLTRVYGVEGFPGDKKVEAVLWDLAESLLPHNGIASYTQGLMDLGSLICRRSRPLCAECPHQRQCVAARDDRVAELPGRRQKKTVPTRYTTMVLMQYRDQVYLERRPPSGIWGGLLSLPECENQQQAEILLARQGQGELLPSLPEVEHVFTHFRLIITPQPVRLDSLSVEAREDSGCWLPLEMAGDAGVPAPVKRLLQKLASGPI